MHKMRLVYMVCMVMALQVSVFADIKKLESRELQEQLLKKIEILTKRITSLEQELKRLETPVVVDGDHMIEELKKIDRKLLDETYYDEKWDLHIPVTRKMTDDEWRKLINRRISLHRQIKSLGLSLSRDRVERFELYLEELGWYK